MHEIVRGRPPVTGRESGPNAMITTLRIPGRVPATRQACSYRVGELPGPIAANVTIDDTSGCWVVGPGNGISIDKDGYARYRGEGVHRIVYTALVGEIPADRPVIDHVKARGCTWRNCCRPDHLEAVTVRTNTMRGSSFAVTNYLKTHCGRCNTPYDLYNTYHYRGRRDCRRCIARRVREYKQRQRATVTTLASAADLGRAA